MEESKIDAPHAHEHFDLLQTLPSKVDPETLEIDHVAERKLVRKLDSHIVPMVMLLYLFSFLDRVNIGNARLYGLEKDLGLKGNDYQTAVSLLFVTYILCELPSNLVLRRFHPSRWIAFLTTSWGIIATLTGITQSYGGLIACRLLLGAVEAGLFPGMTVYLTIFYTKKELALRVGYLFVSAALAGKSAVLIIPWTMRMSERCLLFPDTPALQMDADKEPKGAFGGLLAYGIGFMDGVAGQRGWRWIMILEGLPTFVLGIATWWRKCFIPSQTCICKAGASHISQLPRLSKASSLCLRLRLSRHMLIRSCSSC